MARSESSLRANTRRSCDQAFAEAAWKTKPCSRLNPSTLMLTRALAESRYSEAEPLYQRSLAILERALGPEHPHVAQSLENYAALLRQTARADEAERMEARAKAIRAKSE